MCESVRCCGTEAPNARRPVTLDTYKTIGTIMAIMAIVAIVAVMAIMERVVPPAEGTDGSKKELRECGETKVYCVGRPDEGFSDLTPWVRYIRAPWRGLQLLLHTRPSPSPHPRL